MNGNACFPVVWVSDKQVVCSSPAGTGLLQQVSVVSQSQFSAPVKFLSYAKPAINSVAGCALPSGALASTECNRTGGDVLTIRGQV